MIDVIVGIVGKVLDRVIPDKAEAARIQEALSIALINSQTQVVQAAAEVIKAEAGSVHWVTAAWRPLTMLIFAAIVANNYILAPYVNLFFHVKVALDLPPDMWDVIKIGLGGYVVGRSAEKIAEGLKR